MPAVSPAIQKAMRVAIEHHEAGQLRPAAAIYRRVLEMDPGHAEALHFLGVISHQVGRTDLAEQMLRRSIAADPDKAEFRHNLGNLLFKLARYEQAAQCFRDAVRLDPQHPAAQRHLAAALDRLGQTREAAEWRRRADAAAVAPREVTPPVETSPDLPVAASPETVLDGTADAADRESRASDEQREVATLEPDAPHAIPREAVPENSSAAAPPTQDSTEPHFEDEPATAIELEWEEPAGDGLLSLAPLILEMAPTIGYEPPDEVDDRPATAAAETGSSNFLPAAPPAASDKNLADDLSAFSLPASDADAQSTRTARLLVKSLPTALDVNGHSEIDGNAVIDGYSAIHGDSAIDGDATTGELSAAPFFDNVAARVSTSADAPRAVDVFDDALPDLPEPQFPDDLDAFAEPPSAGEVHLDIPVLAAAEAKGDPTADLNDGPPDRSVHAVMAIVRSTAWIAPDPLPAASPSNGREQAGPTPDARTAATHHIQIPDAIATPETVATSVFGSVPIGLRRESPTTPAETHSSVDAGALTTAPPDSPRIPPAPAALPAPRALLSPPDAQPAEALDATDIDESSGWEPLAPDVDELQPFSEADSSPFVAAAVSGDEADSRFAPAMPAAAADMEDDELTGNFNFAVTESGDSDTKLQAEPFHENSDHDVRIGASEDYFATAVSLMPGGDDAATPLDEDPAEGVASAEPTATAAWETPPWTPIAVADPASLSSAAAAAWDDPVELDPPREISEPNRSVADDILPLDLLHEETFPSDANEPADDRSEAIASDARDTAVGVDAAAVAADPILLDFEDLLPDDEEAADALPVASSPLISIDSQPFVVSDDTESATVFEPSQPESGTDAVDLNALGLSLPPTPAVGVEPELHAWFGDDEAGAGDTDDAAQSAGSTDEFAASEAESPFLPALRIAAAVEPPAEAEASDFDAIFAAIDSSSGSGFGHDDAPEAARLWIAAPSPNATSSPDLPPEAADEGQWVELQEAAPVSPLSQSAFASLDLAEPASPVPEADTSITSAVDSPIAPEIDALFAAQLELIDDATVHGEPAVEESWVEGLLIAETESTSTNLTLVAATEPDPTEPDVAGNAEGESEIQLPAADDLAFEDEAEDAGATLILWDEMLPADAGGDASHVPTFSTSLIDDGTSVDSTPLFADSVSAIGAVRSGGEANGKTPPSRDRSGPDDGEQHEPPEAAATAKNVPSDLALMQQRRADRRRRRLTHRRRAAEGRNLQRIGQQMLHQRRPDEAVTAFAQVVEMYPASAKAHRDLGAAYLRQDRLEEAVEELQKALALRPRFADALGSLGDAFHLLGRLDEAAAAYRKVLQLRPTAAKVHSNLLLTLNYHHRLAPAALHAEHLTWASAHADPLAAEIERHANDSSPERRLRIGYVSPDFRQHSVNYFIEPVLAHHDRERFSVTGYSDVVKPDEITDLISSRCESWRDARGLSDAELARLIRQDGIDILIDLAGHTGCNRLGVFARKPAPVQVTYLGYPNTTGLSTVDYRLTDAVADPPARTERLHSERLVRLPHGFLCFQPPIESPPVALAPSQRDPGRGITFGCFNILPKITPEVMGVWAKILAATPGSRLMLKGRVGALGYPGRQRYVRDIFVYHGVDPSRLVLLNKEESYAKHLRRYDDLDVALDPWPYNGTTTTCEALWMGVPVVTLAGARHASRVGASILSTLDLNELAAPSTEHYARTALALARDADRLAFLRQTLRHRMRRSPLMNYPQFTKELETAYQEMWSTWCRRQGRSASPEAARGVSAPPEEGDLIRFRDDD